MSPTGGLLERSLVRVVPEAVDMHQNLVKQHLWIDLFIKLMVSLRVGHRLSLCGNRHPARQSHVARPQHRHWARTRKRTAGHVLGGWVLVAGLNVVETILYEVKNFKAQHNCNVLGFQTIHGSKSILRKRIRKG